MDAGSKRPRKSRFLRNEVITFVALAAPALRFLNARRLLRLARGLWFERIVGTAKCGINALRQSSHRRGLGHVQLATTLVTVLGVAGMMSIEPANEAGGGFASYADALWWAAMLIATAGSDFWPQSPESRMLTLLLSVYGLAVFGYITAPASLPFSSMGQGGVKLVHALPPMVRTGVRA